MSTNLKDSSAYAVFSKNGYVEVQEITNNYTLNHACETAVLMGLREFKYLTSVVDGDREMLVFNTKGRLL